MGDHHESIVLETSRLLMRSPKREDFDAFAAFLGDEAAARYLGGAQAQSRPREAAGAARSRRRRHLGSDSRGMAREALTVAV